MNNAAWLDETKSFRERAEALVGEMTLEEKVFQTLFSAPAIERLGVPAYNYWNEALHGVARAGVATVFRPPDTEASRIPGRQSQRGRKQDSTREDDGC